MTVTYTAEVATCKGFGCFLKLLLRWRGSIYKLVWLDLIAFLVLYYGLNLLYRFALDEYQKKIFESVVIYCSDYSTLIPLSFILGFYVSIVMTRWWSQYTAMPWPDPIAVFVSAHIHGQDERGRVMRRTIMRYVCLCLTKVLTMVSPRVKLRFPTLIHLVDAGLLVDNERYIIEELDKNFPNHSKHWLPIVWASSIVTRARKEGRIRDDFAVKTIIDELNKFRGQAGSLLSYDMVSVPLVYTQVVTLAVYSYFLTSAVARQWIFDATKKAANIDMYFPVFTLLEFFFYMGWLKVAESLINPWGDDDDDFEVNWLIDRNLQVSYLIVDEMHHEHPQLVKDQYWDEVFPAELPYTLASEPFRDSQPLPSTANIEIPKTTTNLDFYRSNSVKLNEMGSYEDGQGIQFTARHSHSRQNSRPGSVGSQTSLDKSSIRRNPSLSSGIGVLRRLISRESGKDIEAPRSDMSIPQITRLPGSASTASIKERPTIAGSSRLTNETIEEVDEQQQTIQSMRKEIRPSVLNMFPNTPTDPVPIPNSSSQITPTPDGNTDIFFMDNLDETIDDEKSSTNQYTFDDDVDDEFSRLKAEREQERRDRIMKKLSTSSSFKNNQEDQMLLMARQTSDDATVIKTSVV